MNQCKTEELSFHGSGWEFFRIWIVNVLLTVVTLGFYTPWAKVRTNRYFYAQTELAGARFEYLAKPLDLLKGYLVFAGVALVYSLLAIYLPFMGALFFLLIAATAPWLIASAMRFRLNATSYRGIRFSFYGSTAKAYKLFGGYLIVAALPFTLLTLGALGTAPEDGAAEYPTSESGFMLEQGGTEQEGGVQFDFGGNQPDGFGADGTLQMPLGTAGADGSVASNEESPIEFAPIDGLSDQADDGSSQQNPFGFEGQIPDGLLEPEDPQPEMSFLSELGALLAFLLFPLLIYMNWHIRKTFINWAGFGKTQFVCESSFKRVFKELAITYLLAMVLAFVWSLLAGLVFSAAIASMGDPGVGTILFLIVAGLFVGWVSIGLYFYIMVRFKVSMYSDLLNFTRLGESRFEANLDVWRLAKVMTVNFMLTAITLGFYYPFAKVRLTRAIMECLSVELQEDMSQLTAGAAIKSGSTGEMLADGLDLGFSI